MFIFKKKNQDRFFTKELVLLNLHTPTKYMNLFLCKFLSGLSKPFNKFQLSYIGFSLITFVITINICKYENNYAREQTRFPHVLTILHFLQQCMCMGACVTLDFNGSVEYISCISNLTT